MSFPADNARLFKVCFADRARKVLVKAATLEELIDAAIKKLHISEDAYKVVLDDDGTEIDDDDILVAIAALSQTAANLMLLPLDSSWQPPTATVAEANARPERSRAIATVAVAGNADNHSSHSEEVLGANIWKKFPTRLTKCCTDGLKAFDADRRALVVSIADYMIHDLNDCSRKTSARIAKIITQKYPLTFKDTIVVGCGTDSLRQQIYNAVNYRKIDKEKKRRADMRLSDDEENDDPSLLRPEKSRKQDEYGCSEYQPLLPSTETATSQDEKKLKLKNFFESAENDSNEITRLMGDTYPTQRVDINRKTRDLVVLFREWPYLQKSKYLIEHASRLLGKSIQTVWEEGLAMNAKPLRKFITFTEKSRIMKLRRTKDSSGRESDVSPSNVLKTISDAKAASVASESEVALMAVIFPLIAKQLKEDVEYFCKVIPEDVESTELVEFAKQDYPILIVRGKSLFDEAGKCDVILEEKIAIRARGVLDGFLLTFLAYYVFGYVYAPEVSKTLEFIQRVLLQINPDTGHKRKDNKKRKSMSCDAAVMKLAKALETFKDN